MKNTIQNYTTQELVGKSHLYSDQPQDSSDTGISRKGVLSSYYYFNHKYKEKHAHNVKTNFWCSFKWDFFLISPSDFSLLVYKM